MVTNSDTGSADRAALREEHIATPPRANDCPECNKNTGKCRNCYEPWPCPTIRLIDAYEAQAELLEAARDLIEKWGQRWSGRREDPVVCSVCEAKIAETVKGKDGTHGVVSYHPVAHDEHCTIGAWLSRLAAATPTACVHRWGWSYANSRKECAMCGVSAPSAAATEESPSPEQREQWTAEINRAMQASPPDGKIRRE